MERGSFRVRWALLLVEWERKEGRVSIVTANRTCDDGEERIFLRSLLPNAEKARKESQKTEEHVRIRELLKRRAKKKKTRPARIDGGTKEPTPRPQRVRENVVLKGIIEWQSYLGSERGRGEQTGRMVCPTVDDAEVNNSCLWSPGERRKQGKSCDVRRTGCQEVIL